MNNPRIHLFIGILLEEDRDRMYMRVCRRTLRDELNPFEMPPRHFIQLFRLNQEGVVGAIDGTHMEIQAPPQTDEEDPPFVYLNRKGRYSINVMLISDANAKIIGCSARFPGSVHDSAIWQMSQIKNYLRSQYEEHGDKSTHLIGDSGYPLEPCCKAGQGGKFKHIFGILLHSNRNQLDVLSCTDVEQQWGKRKQKTYIDETIKMKEFCHVPKRTNLYLNLNKELFDNNFDLFVKNQPDSTLAKSKNKQFKKQSLSDISALTFKNANDCPAISSTVQISYKRIIKKATEGKIIQNLDFNSECETDLYKKCIFKTESSCIDIMMQPTKSGRIRTMAF
ncbi:hypothetical protein RN001_003744 [Aquatica leii]|uniref:DDE Tnp4 domain-containing protein n=1 Tax=Aquatica leii TaxID=1421715 RepID=A0AAN7SRP8_9COLE|nr:hypothetical protein RN001_003744 [Aquatica leii]